jgi:hypothetical protein
VRETTDAAAPPVEPVPSAGMSLGEPVAKHQKRVTRGVAEQRGETSSTEMPTRGEG